MSQANKNKTIYQLLDKLTVNKCFLIYLEHEKCKEWNDLNEIKEINDMLFSCNAVL